MLGRQSIFERVAHRHCRLLASIDEGLYKTGYELARNRRCRFPWLEVRDGSEEVGGTSVLYLASVPFTELGLESFDSKPLPELAESVQHGIFKWFAPPIGLLVMLGAIRIGCTRNGPREKSDSEEATNG